MSSATILTLANGKGASNRDTLADTKCAGCQPDVTAGRTRDIFPVSDRGQRNGRRASIPFSALFHPKGVQ